MNKEKIIINPPLTPPLSKEGNQEINQDENYLYSNWLICRWGHLPYNPNLKQRASQMRKNMTIAEKYLWKNYLPKFRLIIEVDWEIHDNQIQYDAIRTELLKKYD